MLHPIVLGEMLDDEIAVAKDWAGDRVSTICRAGSNVIVTLSAGVQLVFDAARYDVEPFRVTAVDAQGVALPHERWPGSLSHGIHPVLGRPFVCVRGTYEYHAHPSHLEDHWARYRNTVRLPDLLNRLVEKAQGR